MTHSMSEIAKMRRDYVYSKINEDISKGKKISNRQRSALMKKYWKESKQKYK